MIENVLTIATCVDSLLFFPIVSKIFDVVNCGEESDSRDLNLYLKIIAGINLPILFL